MVQVILSDECLDPPRTLRICFQKVGALQYISHLDLMRTMTRVMARAHLPIRYTGGFNPKPHLVFSAPLSLGTQSPREYVDVTVLKPVDLDAVRIALNAGLPPELAVQEVYYAETKLSDIAGAVYEFVIYTAGADAALAERCQTALNSGNVVVFKRTKSGDKDVNVSGAIQAAQADLDPAQGALHLCVTLRSDSGSFLNPEYLIRFLSRELGILQGDPTAEYYAITRTHLLTAGGDDFR